MRMLVHHAYGDAEGAGLVDEHAGRIRRQIDAREGRSRRIEAEYQPRRQARARAGRGRSAAPTKEDKAKVARAIAKLEKQREKLPAKLAERDERIAEARRRAEDDRKDVAAVGEELVALYADPDELLKHARVVGIGEIEENEFNLNIPRYIDTFEPEPRVDVKDALKAWRGGGAARAAKRYPSPAESAMRDRTDATPSRNWDTATSKSVEEARCPFKEKAAAGQRGFL
jgi:type I restriction enzyme M protein